ILLMIMNLLPVPLFDGGHAMFFLYEGIAQKPLPQAIQWRLQHFGFVLIICLMFYVFYSDISKVVQKHSSEVRYERRKALD
ncbi:MAG: site-2 protease family protein, partial [Candidatus Cloacimonetes bacterium]|nr:site-2 protease family protein [Candidatus Cloacimonadota bacterium]